MPFYDLINPSDQYTFETADEQALQMGVLLFGEGHYALVNDKGQEVLPLLLFGTHERWMADKYGSVDDAMAKLKDRAFVLRMADALSTIALGSVRERKSLEAALATISKEKEREKARNAFMKDRRSSLNDIGGDVVKYVKYLKALVAEGEPEKTKDN